MALPRIINLVLSIYYYVKTIQHVNTGWYYELRAKMINNGLALYDAY